MGKTTIAWTDYTQNFWWGCQKVSPGCQHCYAATFSKRVGRDIWGPTAARWRTSPDNWGKPRKWNALAGKNGTRFRVFAQSMSDLFEDHPDANAWRPEVWPVIEDTPNLDWLLLTKRPENIVDMIPAYWRTVGRWPQNVWLGTSVENHEYAQSRIPALLSVHAPLNFLSCEPLLGPLDLSSWLERLQWVIVGGESGAHARPMDLDWARILRDQCIDAGVPFFFKQTGGVRDAGHDLERIPFDLHVREFGG